MHHENDVYLSYLQFLALDSSVCQKLFHGMYASFFGSKGFYCSCSQYRFPRPSKVSHVVLYKRAAGRRLAMFVINAPWSSIGQRHAERIPLFMQGCLHLNAQKSLAGMARVPITLHSTSPTSADGSPNHTPRRTIPFPKLPHQRLNHAASAHNWR